MSLPLNLNIIYNYKNLIVVKIVYLFDQSRVILKLKLDH